MGVEGLRVLRFQTFPVILFTALVFPLVSAGEEIDDHFATASPTERRDRIERLIRKYTNGSEPCQGPECGTKEHALAIRFGDELASFYRTVEKHSDLRFYLQRRLKIDLLTVRCAASDFAVREEQSKLWCHGQLLWAFMNGQDRRTELSPAVHDFLSALIVHYDLPTFDWDAAAQRANNFLTSVLSRASDLIEKPIPDYLDLTREELSGAVASLARVKALSRQFIEIRFGYPGLVSLKRALAEGAERSERMRNYLAWVSTGEELLFYLLIYQSGRAGLAEVMPIFPVARGEVIGRITGFGAAGAIANYRATSDDQAVAHLRRTLGLLERVEAERSSLESTIEQYEQVILPYLYEELALIIEEEKRK